MEEKSKGERELNVFAGRERELNELKGYLSRAAEGRGQMVLLKGEAGIGKTRLFDHFSKNCEDNGFKVLKGRCLYFERTDPYIPFLEALKDFTEEKEEENNSGFVGTVSHTYTSGRSMSMLGASDEEDIDVSISDRREMMFDKITGLVRKLSEKQPVLLFLDDLQWIDPASGQLMHHLARHTKDSRVLIMGAYRPEELVSDDELPIQGVMERMSREKLVETIELDRLDFQNTSMMVKHILKSEHLPQSFLSMLYKETEGNPYYVKETMDYMMEEGIIDPYSYDWDPEEELSGNMVPPAIKDITQRKIDRLSREEKTLLMYATIIGTEFSFEILENTVDMDVIEMLDILDELTSKGLIHEVEGGEEVFRFNHLQIRLTMYSTMGRSRRRVLHNQVGRAIEDLYVAEDEYCYALSRHFYEGKDYERAYDHCMRAGEMALESYAIEHAIEHYERALDCLRHVRELDGEQEIEILRKIANLAFEMGDMELTKEITEDHLLELTQDKEDKKLESRCHRLLGHIARDVPEYDRARKHYNKAMEISQEIEHHVGEADAQRGLGFIQWREGNLKKAVEHFETAEEMAKKAGRDDILALVHIDMGNVYGHMGMSERAIEYHNKSIPTLEENNSFRELSRVHNNIGDQYMKLEEWDIAIKHFDSSVEYGKKIGNKRLMAWGYFNKAESLAGRGDLEEAEEYAQRAEHIMKTLNDLVGLSATHQSQAIISRKKGDHGKALKYMDKSLDVIKGLDIPFTKGERYYHLGLIYRDMGEKGEAEERLKKAQDIFESIGADRFLKKVGGELEGLY